MATANDDFNRTDASNLGGDWTDIVAGTNILSNTAAGVSSPGGPAYWHSYWSADSFADDQYSEAVAVTVSNDNGCQVGLTVRASGTSSSDFTAYWLLVVFNGSFIFKYVNGVEEDFLSLGVTPTEGKTYKLEVIGSDIKAYEDGVQIGSTYVDSEITSGAPGISTRNSTGASPVAQLDDWEGGDFGGGGGGSQPMMRRWGGRSGPVPGIGQSSGGGKAWG